MLPKQIDERLLRINIVYNSVLTAAKYEKIVFLSN